MCKRALGCPTTSFLNERVSCAQTLGSERPEPLNTDRAGAALQGIGRAKRSPTALVSFATRSLAALTNATNRPFALSVGRKEKLLLLAVPARLILTSVVLAGGVHVTISTTSARSPLPPRRATGTALSRASLEVLLATQAPPRFYSIRSGKQRSKALAEGHVL
jgi:hypothetical protein